MVLGICASGECLLANNANDRNGISPNWCSDDYFVKPGKYKYISNKVYQKKYKYAYLIMGKDDKKRHEVKGKWSPDNISGKY